MAYYLNFIQHWYISLTFGFAFGPFESLPQNFGLFWNGSKFWNFQLDDGENWKSNIPYIYARLLFITIHFQASHASASKAAA